MPLRSILLCWTTHIAVLLGIFTCAELQGLADPAGQNPGGAASKGDPYLENLEGVDKEKGALAARDLLAQIVEKKSPQSEEYRKYLRNALDPDRFTQNGQGLSVAERLVGALGYTAGAGQPFPEEGPELVLKMIGVGPENLRKVVREAVISFARAESQKGESPVITALGELLERNPPPPQVALKEVTGILWRVNSKQLLGNLIGILSRSKARPRSEVGPYIIELRELLGIDFSTIEEWVQWWAENRDDPIEVILEKASHQLRTRQADLWRKILERIKGTLNPEAYLGSLSDSLELDPSPELRVAVAEALGGFPDWLRDGKFPGTKDGEPALNESSKAVFVSNALNLLLKLLDADPNSVTSNRVKRQALVALRRFAAHLEKNPQEEAVIQGVLETRFRTIFSGSPEVPSLPETLMGSERADLVELVRTTGALRIPALRSYLECILRDQKERGLADRELIEESIVALGRLMGRVVVRDTIELIMTYFRANSDPSRRDIRKACVVALNLRIEDSSLRDDVRRFYDEVLANSEDKVGRVPAILGLGILAKAGDLEAVASLAGVLSPSRRKDFELTEATAAVDAIAYLGGRPALEQLLPLLNEQDQQFTGHVWRKVVSNLKSQGVMILEWSLSWCLKKCYSTGEADWANVVMRLTDEPELATFLAPERANAANQEEFLAFWESILARAKALELTGNEPGASKALSMLQDLAVKNGRMKALRPQAEEELQKAQLRLKQLAEVRATLAKNPPPEPENQAKALLTLLLPEDDPEARWRRIHWIILQLQGLKRSPEALKIVETIHSTLSEPDGQGIWNEISPEARTRCLKNLELLLGKLKAPPPGNG